MKMVDFESPNLSNHLTPRLRGFYSKCFFSTLLFVGSCDWPVTLVSILFNNLKRTFQIKFFTSYPNQGLFLIFDENSKSYKGFTMKKCLKIILCYYQAIANKMTKFIYIH